MALLSQLFGALKLCAILVCCLTITVATESSANAAEISFVDVNQGDATVTDTLATFAKITSWTPSTSLSADNVNQDNPKFASSVPTPHVVITMSMGVPKFMTFWNSTTFASATTLNTSASCTSLAPVSFLPTKSTPSISDGTAQWVTATSAPSTYPDFANEESISLALIQAAVDGIIPTIKHREVRATTETPKVTVTHRCAGVTCLPLGMIGRNLDKAAHTTSFSIPKVTTQTRCTYANRLSCLPLGEIGDRDVSTPAPAAAEETGIQLRKVHHSSSSRTTTTHHTTTHPLSRIFHMDERVADTTASQISGRDALTPAPATEVAGIQVRNIFHDIGKIHHNNSTNSTGGSNTITTARSPLTMLILMLMLVNME